MEKNHFTDEAVLIANPSNLLYFSNYKNSDAKILIIGNDKYYFTDSRYLEETSAQLRDFHILNFEELPDTLKKNGITELGIEDSLPQITYNALIDCGIKTFHSIESRVRKIRSVKSEYELDCIRKAQEITDKTFNNLLPAIREGITEIELAGTLESLLYVNGAEDLAFTSIVAFDENTSKPHAHRTDKKLKNGSIITLDFGAKYKNYCSDMTRTIAFGSISTEQKNAYKHVLTAQELALSIIYAGMTGKECDSMSRNYFKENGLDKFFIHSLGHGVGLDIHESPYLSQKSEDILEENTVVTVEPGLYFEKEFGIRIEDLIIVNKTSVINLTKSSKNIIIL